MSLSDLAALGSFVSGMAVLASLALLWFQLRQMSSQVRQSEKNQRAQIRQVHSMRISEAFLGRVDHADLWVKAFSGEELSDAEVYQVVQAMSAVWFSVEDSYHQYRDGLLDEATWQANLAGLRYGLRMPYLRAVWPFIRPSTVGADFVVLVDALLAQTQPIATDQVIAAYRASIAREVEAAAGAAAE
jgi:hypothetical protein